MGVLFSVHNELGPSLLEKYYQRGIEKLLKQREFNFLREVAVNILLEGEIIGKYYLDFLDEDLVILEVKASPKNRARFNKQAVAYMKQLDVPLAIMANFRSRRLNYKRIINPDFKDIDLTELDNKFI